MSKYVLLKIPWSYSSTHMLKNMNILQTLGPFIMIFLISKFAILIPGITPVNTLQPPFFKNYNTIIIISECYKLTTEPSSPLFFKKFRYGRIPMLRYKSISLIFDHFLNKYCRIRIEYQIGSQISTIREMIFIQKI